ncbi:hypothetical protein ASD11_04545 [Aeromicrobium sp. Root495]|nr:hypothetical protein ASD11_04545 [Aeromicrobium sp. Root495]
MHDLDTGKTIETTERQALLSGLRACFYLPEDSFYGVLMVEKAGRRNLRDVLYSHLVKPIALGMDCVIKLESFAESSDWRRELNGKEAVRVSEILSVKSTADDGSTPDETVVEIGVKGHLVSRASNSVFGLIERRAEKRVEKAQATSKYASLSERERRSKIDKTVSFSVQDEAEIEALSDELSSLSKAEKDQALTDLLSGIIGDQRDDAEHKSWHVAVGEDGRAERTFAVDREAVPQFVYETQGVLSDAQLKTAWDAHADKVLHLLEP